MIDEAEITRDTLLRGRVKLLQPRSGYRSSLDPVLLAGFIAPPFGRFLDIGCASGALSFLLLARDEAASGVGVEIQPRLAELAERGTIENGFHGRFHVVAADVRAPDALEKQAFDLVATNPPFRPLGTGNLPPLSEMALAHHEVTLSLAEWLDLAARALRPGGRLATIFPFERWQELHVGLSARGFSIARSRPVVPREGGSPGRILLEARLGKCEGKIESPLVVHDSGGYTAEVRRMLGEDV
jgi:tRNA1Val (adenine37-N6)-methyltransferase